LVSALKSFLDHFREVVHSSISMVVLPKPCVECMLYAIKVATMVLMKQMAVEKSSLSGSLQVASPKQLFTYPRNGLIQTLARFVKLLFAREHKRESLIATHPGFISLICVGYTACEQAHPDARQVIILYFNPMFKYLPCLFPEGFIEHFGNTEVE